MGSKFGDKIWTSTLIFFKWGFFSRGRRAFSRRGVGLKLLSYSLKGLPFEVLGFFGGLEIGVLIHVNKIPGR